MNGLRETSPNAPYHTHTHAHSFLSAIAFATPQILFTYTQHLFVLYITLVFITAVSHCSYNAQRFCVFYSSFFSFLSLTGVVLINYIFHTRRTKKEWAVVLKGFLVSLVGDSSYISIYYANSDCVSLERHLTSPHRSPVSLNT